MQTALDHFGAVVAPLASQTRSEMATHLPARREARLRRVVLIVGVAILGGLAYLGYQDGAPHYFPSTIERAMQDVGDIELNHATVTYQELVKGFGVPDKFSRNSTVYNVLHVRWWGGAVNAEFMNCDRKMLEKDPHSQPYEISVRDPFKGTLARVHIGDDLARVTTSAKPFNPSKGIQGPTGPTEHQRLTFDCGDPYSATCFLRNGRVFAIEVRRTDLVLQY